MGGEAPLQAELEAWCRARAPAFAGAALGGAGAGGASEEHPLAWTALFDEYTARVEAALAAALRAVAPPAEMDEVEALFTARAADLSGDVFDVLFSLGDYGEFVSLMRSYAEQLAYEAGAAGAPAFAGLAPTVLPVARAPGAL